MCIYMTQRTFRGARKCWADLVDTAALSKKQGGKEIKERQRQFAKKDRRQNLNGIEKTGIKP